MNSRYLILIQSVKFYFTFLFAVDPSLSIVEKLGIVPYGITWVLFNLPSYLVPYSYGTPNTYLGFNLMEWQYKFYLWLLDCVFTYITFKKLSSLMFTLSQLEIIHWFMGFYQSITVQWFSTLGLLNPLFTLFAIGMKLPIGWGNPFDFNNPHIQCALYCGGHTDVITDFFLRRTLVKVVTYVQ